MLIGLILLFFPRSSFADIRINDSITPFIADYRALQKPSEAQLESLILRNEFVLSRELGETYYNRLSQSEKQKLIARNLGPLVNALPAMIPMYEKKLIEIRLAVVKIEDRYKKILNINPAFPVYLWTALENTDGKSTNIDGTPGFSLNFRLIAESNPTELEILVAHEFFHVVQDKIVSSSHEESVARNLMSEGWSTYVSSLIVPGAQDYKYISYWMTDDLQYREYQKHRGAAAAALLKDFEKSEWKIQRKYFSGDPQDSGPFPPRIGYYVGYELAKRIARAMPPAKVAAMTLSEFKPLAKKHLREMISEEK